MERRDVGALQSSIIPNESEVCRFPAPPPPEARLMAYRCERCGRVWEDQDASDNGHLCTRQCGGVLRPSGITALLARLPLPLAVVLREYLVEDNDHVKLHRLCDAAEMLTRFLTTAALAEIAATEDGFPPALRQVLLDSLERPTPGSAGGPSCGSSMTRPTNTRRSSSRWRRAG
jgi:hypothetical protein